jgi:dolichol-phosphate mannosyltransferase
MGLAFDGIFNFSVLPLRFIFWIGLGSSIAAMFGLAFFVLHRIFGFKVFGHTPADVPGFTSLILAILLVGGIQLLSIGVLGEYLGRIYLEVKNRPEYVVLRMHPSLYGQRVAAIGTQPHSGS